MSPAENCYRAFRNGDASGLERNRYDKIVAMIEESEKLKSSTENRALVLADRLVPWCLGATVVTYALTHPDCSDYDCCFICAHSSTFDWYVDVR